MARLIAWIGGAAFVASLALCTWWYFVALGRPAAGGGWPAFAVDAALVTLFAAHHSVFARDAVKRRLTAIPAPLVRSFYVWVASVLLIVVVVGWRQIGGTLYDVRGAARVASAAVQLFGVWLIAKSAGVLDPLELAGIRQAALEIRPAEPLQVGGPYAWVRHPLYLGWILALFGTHHMTGDRLAFAALTSAYLVMAVPWEERSLEQSFGDEYRVYARRVRWRLVPLIY